MFIADGELLRQVNPQYREHFDHLIDSGLYQELVDAHLLIPHDEVSVERALETGAYKVIRPERIGFISYPYEWCFSELKDAALTTLAVQKLALARGMVLKDASAYNVQFHDGRPLLIDTLSFERYREGEPWVAYRQFCEHFLAPLALMSRVDVRLISLLRNHIDGVPLDLASALLPRRSYLSPSLLTHVHLHAKSQGSVAMRSGAAEKAATARVSPRGLAAIIGGLESAVSGLHPKKSSGHWSRYYDDHRYSDRSFEHKREIVSGFLERISPTNVWDLGANTGMFSRIAAERQIPTVALELDHDAVEASYRKAKEDGETHLLPLVLDLTNPSPAIGWAHRERSSLVERGPADAVLALALVHHIAIANNVPLPTIARYFAELSNWLVIELVPKEDEQAQRLLASRRDIFEDYNPASFERAFETVFEIVERIPVDNSSRILYLMRTRGE